ncbi:hypothetical protein Hdeb2414_s0002g00051331 [Helianthus debilis subsp. tardiflorus]
MDSKDGTDKRVKPKTITKVHNEAEKNLRLRARSTVSIRNIKAQESINLNIKPPSTGGMMPEMPGTRVMLGTHGLENDNWEVQRSRLMPRGVQPPLLNKDTVTKSEISSLGSGRFISGKPSALLPRADPC